jgi:redox-sensitive bicupin YhaK (pirin superfamily)
VATDAAGAHTEVACIAGRLAGTGAPPAPPPDSWAAQPESDLAIWTLKMAPGARFTLPPAAGAGTRRKLYFFKGRSVAIDDQTVAHSAAIELPAQQPTELANGPETSEFLLLQGRPIGEPVAQYGPFVMNTQQELQQAFADYRSTAFGGWPWPDDAPVHGPGRARFARHVDGQVERFAQNAP